MSDMQRLLQQDASRVLDRLVDGELSADEQRELLAALDEEPGGWRRCALAFVEAAVWRGALGDMTSPAMCEPHSRVSAMPVGRRAAELRAARSAWMYAAALAASVLLAFACGRHLAAPAREPIQPVAHSPAPAAHSPAPVAQLPVAPAPQGALPADSPVVQAAWKRVQVKVGDAAAGQPDTVDVPCLDVSQWDTAALQASQLESQWLAVQSSALPDELLQSLRETGYAVQTQRQWWPLDMGDGRRVVVPIEQVEVRYVGGQFY